MKKKYLQTTTKKKTQHSETEKKKEIYVGIKRKRSSLPREVERSGSRK